VLGIDQNMTLIAEEGFAAFFCPTSFINWPPSSLFGLALLLIILFERLSKSLSKSLIWLALMLLNFGPSYLGLADLFYSSFDQDQMYEVAS